MYEAQIETMSRGELEVLQLERLQSTLNRAYLNVAHYGRAFNTAEILPEDIRSLDDLQKLPFTTREEIESCYPYDMFAVPLREVVRLHTSSGYNRKSIVTGYTPGDLKTWARAVARFLAATGINRDDVIQIAFRYGLMTGAFGYHSAAELIGASVIPADVGNTEEQVTIMRDYLPSAIACTPSFALVLIDKLDQLSINPKSLRLRRALLGGERLTAAMRAKIEQDLDVEVFDSYGASIVLGPGIAGECRAHAGMHIAEDFFLAEIIDPATGLRVPEGQTGELVITTLAREAFPIIRYRTGDITSFIPGACSCGRTHARLSSISSRTDDMVKIKGVSIAPSLITRILSEQGVQTRTQLHITREGAYEKADVLLEVVENLMFDGMREQRAFLEKLEKALHAGTGIHLNVKIIPFSALKDPGLVVDDRK